MASCLALSVWLGIKSTYPWCAQGRGAGEPLAASASSIRWPAEHDLRRPCRRSAAVPRSAAGRQRAARASSRRWTSMGTISAISRSSIGGHRPMQPASARDIATGDQGDSLGVHGLAFDEGHDVCGRHSQRPPSLNGRGVSKRGSRMCRCTVASLSPSMLTAAQQRDELDRLARQRNGLHFVLLDGGKAKPRAAVPAGLLAVHIAVRIYSTIRMRGRLAP